MLEETLKTLKKLLKVIHIKSNVYKYNTLKNENEILETLQLLLLLLMSSLLFFIVMMCYCV